MKDTKIQHKKIGNVGILFDLLVRQITSDALVNRPISEAVGILQNYFKVTTELGKELQFYRALLETTKLSEARASNFIELVLEQRRKLDNKKLAKEKYELINEIQKHYNLKEFLSARIPEYTLQASIYKTFASQNLKSTDTAIANINEIATARFAILEHLTSTGKKVTQNNEDVLLNEFKDQTHELRLLTYKLAVDKFNERYTTLDNNQKALLKEYIENMSKSNSLAKYVRQEIPKTQKLLTERSDAMSDEVMKIKLCNVSNQLGEIMKKTQIHDGEINALLIAYEILKEISHE